MKSERRHELKENALAKDLGKAGEFIKAHLRGLVIGFVAVIVVLFLVIQMVGRWSDAREKEWENFFVLSITRSENAGQWREDMLSLANDASQDSLAAWAYVKVGDVTFVELTGKRPTLTDEQASSLRGEVESAYKTVIDRYADNTRAVAKAHLGLGRLAETFGDLDAAKAAYTAAAALEPQGARLVGAEANLGLMRLERAGEPVALPQRPETQPAEEPAEQPAEEPAAEPVG